jgi:large subunit ribosomal protein L17
MLRNQATALLLHEHLTTTVAKAKELRPFVERLITVAKRGLAQGAPGKNGKNGGADGIKVLNARRLVMQDLQDRDVVAKLFDTVAPRFESRQGGYTRLLRLGFRKGDAAEMAQVELIGSEFDPRAKAEPAEGAAEPAPKKGVGGRLKAAADRLRGKQRDDEGPGGGAKKASTKPSKGAGRKSTTPRKMGGGG